MLQRDTSKWSSSLEWAIGILGVFVAVWYLPGLTRLSIWTVLFLLVLAIVLEAIPVPIGKTEATLIFVIPLGLVAAYSSSAAICVLAAAELLTPFLVQKRRKWSTWLFNAGQYALSAYVMALVFHLVAGQSRVAADSLNWRVVVAVIVSGLTLMIVNHLFITTILRVRRNFVRSDLVALVTNDGLSLLASFPFVLFFIVAAGPLPVLAPVLMTPLAFIGQLFRLYRRMTVLRDIHTAVLKLTSEFDIDTICEQAASTAARVTYADAVSVYTLSEEKDVLMPSIIYPTTAIHDFNLEGIPKSAGGVIWSIVESGTWGYVPHTKHDVRVKDDGANGREYLSLAVFPMQTRGETQGAIVLYSLRPYAFGEYQEYLQVLSGQVAVLIENAKLYQQLQEQSWHDGATGLYNYRFLYEELERWIRDAEKTQKHLSLAVLDLDYFKKFNDTYGHLAGDAVLRSVGVLLSGMAGSDSIVARYGGEEFAVLMPVGPELANERVEAMRVAIARHVVDFQGYQLQGISVSAGIASYPDHAMDDRDLLLKADSAMYWGAKERGRNRVACYSPEFDAQLFVDQLTGLYTYHFVNIRLREEMEKGIQSWGALCIDVENFSFINSAFGFGVGDEILRRVSLILTECLRTNELACRFGGDEFLVLLPGVSAHELAAIALRLKRAVQSFRFEFANNVVISVRIRQKLDVVEDVGESGAVFELVGQMFATLNDHVVSELPSV
ncbi:hypothetical protein AN477_18370 [Alicyclobacillus ferrooxydans]|uniref:GGDEF domain-containing protein n=2 Tax=Alicyclobacillus ferrooxydans TaxID=471514 RepID=A0A0P9ETR9_9BACL|nr:hypothetical protein AN477_18370 [Alicyclobacillus ferrooxydans]